MHLATVASAWAYNLRLKSTVWSWAPYAFSFGFLPLAIALALPGRAGRGVVGDRGGALLGIGAHGANVIPDLQDDRATGVRGLPHRLGGTATSIGSAAALVAATVLVVLAPPRDARGRPRPARSSLAVGLTILGTAIALSGGPQPAAVHRSRSRSRPWTSCCSCSSDWVV